MGAAAGRPVCVLGYPNPMADEHEQKDADLGTRGRVVATLAARGAGRDTARGWMAKRGFAGRIGRYLHHPEIGADLLAAAGSAPLTVAWAKEHHTPAEAWTIDPAIGRVLFEVDDD